MVKAESESKVTSTKNKSQRTVKHSKPSTASTYRPPPKTYQGFPILLSESDLFDIGWCTSGNNEGGTVFVCSHSNANIEKIFIRSILTPINFQIIDVEDYVIPGEDFCDVKIVTNYPWSRYMGKL